LIYNTNLELHVEHLFVVLSVLTKKMLHVNIEKCTFYIEQITLLGFVVSDKGIQVYHERVKAIQE